MNIALACLWEATARKLGNVHPTAPFADMEYFDFVKSGLALQQAWSGDDFALNAECRSPPPAVAAPRPSSTSPLQGEVGVVGGRANLEASYTLHLPLQGGGRRSSAARTAGGGEISLGERIYRGVEATRAAVKKNTNLGIVLLLAPLLDRREKRLRETTLDDARNLYRAIRLASPGGMGTAEVQDVNDEPTCTLFEAMALAADRDMIAQQYANGFADVLDFGVPAFLRGIEQNGCVEAAIIECQLQWLAEFPDSLIARKNGSEIALGVQQRAEAMLHLGGLKSAGGRAAGVELDRHLRSDGHRLNPGTTADLVTACLFVALREGKVDTELPFRWNVPDWL